MLSFQRTIQSKVFACICNNLDFTNTTHSPRADLTKFCPSNYSKWSYEVFGNTFLNHWGETPSDDFTSTDKGSGIVQNCLPIINVCWLPLLSLSDKLSLLIFQHRASSSTLTPHRVSFVPYSFGLKVQELHRAVKLGNVHPSQETWAGRSLLPSSCFRHSQGLVLGFVGSSCSPPPCWTWSSWGAPVSCLFQPSD